MTFRLDVKRAYRLVATIALLAMVCDANAADMPIKAPPLAPIYGWSGFYVGANVGYSYGPWNSTSLGTIFPAGLQTSDPKVKGWLGGAQAGYNWQFNRIVLGVEGDYQITGEKASNTDAATFGPILFQDSTLTATTNTSNEWKFPWLATIRGRAGYAADDWLLYGTGGAAAGRAKFSTTTAATLIKTPPNPFTLSAAATEVDAKTRWGWTLGAGVEKALGQNFSVKFEYLYVDLGSYTFLSGTGLDTTVKLHDHILRVGLNYRFSGPLTARY